MSARKQRESNDFRPQALEAHAARVDDFANSRETLEFFVKGRAKEPYRVVFSRNGTNLTAHCTCPGCLRGYHCKHRINLLLGSKKGLVYGSDADLDTLQDWLAGSDVEGPLEEFAMAQGDLSDRDPAMIEIKRRLAEKLKD